MAFNPSFPDFSFYFRRSRLFRRRSSAKEEPAPPTYVQEEFADFEANQHLCVLREIEDRHFSYCIQEVVQLSDAYLCRMQ
ncbi:hypothetical protein CDAR_535561 [Caerostris darwini]|uniref:Uncharacterized protein n=1 Tax=Caerostris darwini TaxID=1538125 RepID=A0AAV4QQ77_9ARAC|nr:hypothetical protein CDAR_535561 [Caerostris darwini]